MGRFWPPKRVQLNMELVELFMGHIKKAVGAQTNGIGGSHNGHIRRDFGEPALLGHFWPPKRVQLKMELVELIMGHI